MSPSKLESLLDWFQWGYVGILILTVFLTAAIVISTRKLNEIRKKEIALANQKAAEANEKAETNRLRANELDSTNKALQIELEVWPKSPFRLDCYDI